METPKSFSFLPESTPQKGIARSGLCPISAWLHLESALPIPTQLRDGVPAGPCCGLASVGTQHTRGGSPRDLARPRPGLYKGQGC